MERDAVLLGILQELFGDSLKIEYRLPLDVQRSTTIWYSCRHHGFKLDILANFYARIPSDAVWSALNLISMTLDLNIRSRPGF